LNLGIQGEIVGPGIQGNKYELPEIDLFVFNIYDINQQTYFNELEIELFCKKYGLKMVPVLGFFMLDNIPITDYFVELSRGKSILDLAILREGIVIRTTTDKSISFKAINPDFLEKYKE
jgi:ATP-dependent RNA circularization protein (DNA/RNA ligase family)